MIFFKGCFKAGMVEGKYQGAHRLRGTKGMKASDCNFSGHSDVLAIVDVYALRPGLAERVGIEPTVPLPGQQSYRLLRFGHSRTSPLNSIRIK